MLSGRRLDLLSPSPDDIDLDDIAHGLARVARWNGQTSGPHILSVAQHSLLVEALAGHLDPSLDRTGRLTTLLHDAPEYVIGDLISPYKAVEQKIFDAILGRFGLEEPDRSLLDLVKRADRAAAHLEATLLAGFEEPEITAILGPPEPELQSFAPWLAPAPADAVQQAFLHRCRNLLEAPA